MNEQGLNKKAALETAAQEIQKIFSHAESIDTVLLIQQIISDISWPGYVISRCKIQGSSHQQCANKLGISKRQVQHYWEKCTALRYDIALKTIFLLK